VKYRKLGNTGMEVSCIGLGCLQVGSSQKEYAVQVVRRALELGVNYFDTARAYHDSEIHLGAGLKGKREKVYVSSKTFAKTKEEAWQCLNESLERLQTDYLDNYHLHSLGDIEDVELRMGPGGALEALVEAKARGLIRHIGCTSHRSDILIEALQRFGFEIILVPMNIVEREPLDRLIPLCLERGVGVSIMKPLAAGVLPPVPSLKWLLNQPISTVVPGATTVEEVEANSRLGHGDPALTGAEQEEVARLAHELEHVRCRLCNACMPCHVGIPIDLILGTDVVYTHYRIMGPAAFAAFPWEPKRVKEDCEWRLKWIEQIEACDNCGQCEEKCPYGLSVVSRLKALVPSMKDMLRIFGEQGLFP
jgi:predicted aldo/keto reductase-like oxidoreductase